MHGEHDPVAVGLEQLGERAVGEDGIHQMVIWIDLCQLLN